MSGQEEAPEAEATTRVATSATSTPSEAVRLPQLGESITEATVMKWHKEVGDRIEKDEPLLEVLTDKVDVDIHSPSAGTLLEVRVREGETVEVGAVVGWVGAEGAATVQSPEPKVQSQLGDEPPSAVPPSGRGGNEPGS